MSSTTSPRPLRDRIARPHPTERTGAAGQVLVLFAGGVFALLVVAALAFDVGMMLLERRDAQNAADAAALGAARYVFEADCVAPAWACVDARAAAVRIAAANGYDGTDPNETVVVDIPAVDGRYEGLPYFVEVKIDSIRDSIFGGVIGRVNWPIGVFAVATNQQDVSYPFSMIALNRTKCDAVKVTGTGSITAAGNIQSNSNGSDCTGAEVGFLVSGQGSVDVIADDATCRSAGDIQQSGGGVMTCTKDADSFILPDPLRNQEPPGKPGLPQAIEQVFGPSVAIPSGCPGAGNAATEAAPAKCDLGKTKSVSGVRWVIYPGLYPGGLAISNEAIAYMMPGTYWIGGGGISMTKGGMVSAGSMADALADVAACPNATAGQVDSAGCLWPHSVDTNGDNLPDPDPCFADDPVTCWDTGGIMIYNSELPTSAGGAISLGGSTSTLLITAPMNDPDAIVDDIVIWQDKILCGDTYTVKINGNSSYVEVGGLIYSPCAPVLVNGNGGTIILDQIIADSFTLNGNGGNIAVLDRTNLEAEIIAAGLVD